MATSTDIEVLSGPEAVAARGAELFALAAQQNAVARGVFAAVLSGGRTPRELYRHLARQTLAQKIPWRRVQLFWGDERCVAPDDPASNYALAREAFIRHVTVPEANVHRMRGEDDPEAAATAYEAELKALARTQRPPGDLPVFDLVLLGLGSDGHTASLFPHSPALSEEERLCVPNEGEATGPRLTLTLPVINAARHVLFVVTGAEKAGVVAEVFEGLRIPDAVPAQAVAPARGRVTWLLEEAAAAELSP
jgi:6-phosphogluconolactonase